MKKYFIQQFLKIASVGLASVFIVFLFARIASAQVAPPAGAKTDYAVGSNPYDIAFDNITNSVWVINSGSDTVSKININTGTRTDYAVGDHPASIAFDNITNSVWVVNLFSNTISKVDINSGAKIDYSIGSSPYYLHGVAFDNATNSVWVANRGSITISKVNIYTGDKTDYSVARNPYYIAFDNVTNSVWVANYNSNTVSKVDINTGTRVDYPVGRNPYRVAFDNVTNSVWVTNSGSNTVSKVDINTGTRVDYSVGNSPYGVVFDNITNSVWVVNNWSNTVSKIAIRHPSGVPQPPKFLSQVKNVSNSWNFRKNPGTKIPGTQTDKSSDDIIKTVPVDWVLKVATTTDSTGNYFDLDDGYRWYGVVDVTDGAVGWMAAKKLADGTEYLSYNASNQVFFESKANATLYQAKEARIPVVLQAVDTYHTQPNTSSSLYGGGGGFDGGNNFQTFIQGSTFPKELVTAIIGQESGIINFDNEGCATGLDGGIGIMQITSLDARGSGSALKNYPKMGDCTAVSTSKYYSNAWQGIFANIKDGFRTLQDKYSRVGKTEAVDNVSAGEMKAISTVYRYNQGSPYRVQAVYEIWTGKSNDYVWDGYLKYIYSNNRAGADIWMQRVKSVCASSVTFKNCLVNTEVAGLTTSAFYLRNVGSNLLNSSFGAAYQNTAYGDKLIAANNSQLILFLRSPAELRLMNQAGEITGSVGDEPREEIANSVYVPEQKFITLFFPRGQYKYRVAGLATGEYGLSADFVNNSEHTFFDADYILTHTGEIHDYTVDWDKMSRCERGAVTLEIDYEGDGVTDRIVKGGCRITDTEPPVISISSPAGDILINSQARIHFIATDALSGVASTTATLNGIPVSDEQAVTLTKPGSNTLEVTAVDNEGNEVIATSTFSVLYNMSGFLLPVTSDGSKVYNQGRTLPVKFELRDVNGNAVSSANARLYVAKVSNGVAGDDIITVSSSTANTGNYFRYDTISQMYIFNLSTATMLLGTWRLKAVLDSKQEIKANVLIKSK